MSHDLLFDKIGLYQTGDWNAVAVYEACVTGFDCEIVFYERCLLSKTAVG